MGKARKLTIKESAIESMKAQRAKQRKAAGKPATMTREEYGQLKNRRAKKGKDPISPKLQARVKKSLKRPGR